VPVPCPIDLPADLAALLERVNITPERTVLTFRVEAGYLNNDANEGYDEATLALFRRMTAALAQEGYTVHDGLYEWSTELWLYIRRTRI
jgi:hypothetical protein